VLAEDVAERLVQQVRAGVEAVVSHEWSARPPLNFSRRLGARGPDAPSWLCPAVRVDFLPMVSSVSSLGNRTFVEIESRLPRTSAKASSLLQLLDLVQAVLERAHELVLFGSERADDAVAFCSSSG